MNTIKRFIFFSCFIIRPCVAVQATYLASVTNNTINTVYEIFFASEAYSIQIAPMTTKSLGHWVDLEHEPLISIAPIKGDGQSIYLHYGPEAAGECATIPQMVQVWTGQPLPPADQKTYLTCCLTDENAQMSLTIDEDGAPHVIAGDGVSIINQA